MRNDINSPKTDSENLTSQVKNENLESAKGSPSGYEFVTETIKKRPVNKRRIVVKTLFTIFLAVIFGVVACVVFIISEPYVRRYLPVSSTAEEETRPVTLNDAEAEEIPASDGSKDSTVSAAAPVDTTDNTNSADSSIEPTSEIKEVVLNEAADNTIIETDENPQDVNGETASEEPSEEPEEAADEMSADEELYNKLIGRLDEHVEENLISDYVSIYSKIGDVGSQVKKSIAVVSGLSSEMDWFENTYEGKDNTMGLIVAENGKELLVLARTGKLNNADTIEVTFCDGKSYIGHLKKTDVNTNLSIVGVDLVRISKATMDEIQMATLGSSIVKSISGKPVIVVGDPYGTPDSIAIGQITSEGSVKNMIDTNATVLTTNIYGSTNASGVIADFEGKILGIVCQEGNTLDTKNLIRAYGITDLKSKIEKMSNGQDLAYLGIKGIDVTEEANLEYGVPMGAFVSEVIVDSPAMREGIRTGDVIVKMGTTDIASFSEYKDAMLKCQPGDELVVTVMRKSREKYIEFTYEIKLNKLIEY